MGLVGGGRVGEVYEQEVWIGGLDVMLLVKKKLDEYVGVGRRIWRVGWVCRERCRKIGKGGGEDVLGVWGSVEDEGEGGLE